MTLPGIFKKPQPDDIIPMMEMPILPQNNEPQQMSAETEATVKAVGDLLSGKIQMSDLMDSGLPDPVKTDLQQFSMKFAQSLMAGVLTDSSESGFAMGDLTAIVQMNGDQLSVTLLSAEGAELLHSRHTVTPQQFLAAIFNDLIQNPMAGKIGPNSALANLLNTAEEARLEGRRDIYMNVIHKGPDAPDDAALQAIPTDALAKMAINSAYDMQLTDAERRAKEMLKGAMSVAAKEIEKTPAELAEHLRLQLLKHQNLMAEIIESAVNGTQASFPPMPSFIENQVTALKQSCRNLYLEAMNDDEKNLWMQCGGNPTAQGHYFKCEPDRAEKIIRALPQDLMLGFANINRNIDEIKGQAEFSIWNVSGKVS